MPLPTATAPYCIYLFILCHLTEAERGRGRGRADADISNNCLICNIFYSLKRSVVLADAVNGVNTPNTAYFI